MLYIMWGVSFLKLEKYTKALKYFEKAWKIKDQLNDSWRDSIQEWLIEYYTKVGNQERVSGLKKAKWKEHRIDPQIVSLIGRNILTLPTATQPGARTARRYFRLAVSDYRHLFPDPLVGQIKLSFLRPTTAPATLASPDLSGRGRVERSIFSLPHASPFPKLRI